MTGAAANLGHPADSLVMASPGFVESVGIDLPALRADSSRRVEVASIYMGRDMFECFDEAWSAAGRARRMKRRAAVPARQRCMFQYLIGGKIIGIDPAAAICQVGADALAERTAVETIRPVLGKRLQSIGQFS